MFCESLRKVSHLNSATILPVYNSGESLADEFVLFFSKKIITFRDTLLIYLFIWGFTSLSTLYRSYHDG